MTDEIQYILSKQQDALTAVLHGKKIGEITYVRVGIDKLIIDYTAVEPEYRNQHIGLTLVRNVADMARNQHRHVITLCPFARAMFNRFPEFDDIRLMNAH
ncbi:MAG: N-acetyltransferase [Alphaproteobacteria bacterium]|jgi:predicted GNAT family acetyltransferase|nr:N-acetyltransferase [Alphaproteobacteria bacterium]